MKTLLAIVSVVLVVVAVVGAAAYTAPKQDLPQLSTTPANDSFLLCESFGGVKKIKQQSTSTSQFWTSYRIDIECGDGSWVSRTIWK